MAVPAVIHQVESFDGRYLVIENPDTGDPEYVDRIKGRRLLSDNGRFQVWAPVEAEDSSGSAGLFDVGSGSGFKLAGQWLDLYTQGAIAEGVRFWYTPDAVTAWSLAGQIAAATSSFPGAGNSNLIVLQITNFVGFEVVTTDVTQGHGFTSSQYSTDVTPAVIQARKARGTPSAPAAVVGGDQLLQLRVLAYDGTNWNFYGWLTYTLDAADITKVQLSAQGRNAVLFSASERTGIFSVPGPINVPVTQNGTYAASSYGTVPVKLAEVTLSAAAASIVFSSIPSAFRNLRLSGIARSDTGLASTDLKIRFNGDTAANYNSHVMGADGITDLGAVQIINDTSGQAGIIPVAADLANNFGVFEVQVPMYAGTTALKGYLYRGGFFSASGGRQRHGTGEWAGTAAINSITLLPLAGNFIAGSTVTLWGEP